MERDNSWRSRIAQGVTNDKKSSRVVARHEVTVLIKHVDQRSFWQGRELEVLWPRMSMHSFPYVGKSVAKFVVQD